MPRRGRARAGLSRGPGSRGAARSPTEDRNPVPVDISEKCVICEELVLNGKEWVKVKHLGLKTLLSASEERTDGLQVHFQHVNTINLHIRCRPGYINKKNIESAIAKRKELESRGSLHASREGGEGPTQRRLRSTAPTFKSEEQCLYCAEHVLKQYTEEQKRSERKKTIHVVTTIKKKEEAIRRAAQRRGDQDS